MIKEWNNEDLEAFLNAKLTGVVYLYTPLCGTCQVASRMLQIVVEMMPFEIGKMNLNFQPYVAVNMAVESVPCLLLIKDGIVTDKVYAFHSVPFLLEKLQEYQIILKNK